MTHELTQRAIEAWNAKGDASVEDRMEAVIACVRAHDAGNVLVSRPVAVADLVDGDRYLVETKHGMIEGQWQATYEHFSAYYWHDMDFWGDAYTLPERPATPSPATGERDAVLEEGPRTVPRHELMQCATCGGTGADENPFNDPGPCPDCDGSGTSHALQSRPAERK